MLFGDRKRAYFRRLSKPGAVRQSFPFKRIVRNAERTGGRIRDVKRAALPGSPRKRARFGASGLKSPVRVAYRFDAGLASDLPIHADARVFRGKRRKTFSDFMAFTCKNGIKPCRNRTLLLASCVRYPHPHSGSERRLSEVKHPSRSHWPDGLFTESLAEIPERVLARTVSAVKNEIVGLDAAGAIDGFS